MKACPVCGASAAKLRSGPLGEVKGVWCTECGHKTSTIAAWEDRPRQGRIQIDFEASPNPLTLDETVAHFGAYPRMPGETDAALQARLADHIRTMR